MYLRLHIHTNTYTNQCERPHAYAGFLFPYLMVTRSRSSHQASRSLCERICFLFGAFPLRKSPAQPSLVQEPGAASSAAPHISAGEPGTVSHRPEEVFMPRLLAWWVPGVSKEGTGFSHPGTHSGHPALPVLACLGLGFWPAASVLGQGPAGLRPL